MNTRICFRSFKSNLFVLAALLCVIIGGSTFAARGDTLYYASATMGTPGASGGDVVGSDQFIGVRFNVAAPITITGIGGHIGSFIGGNFFGAIVRLTSFTDFPDSKTLDTPDVLSVTILSFPMPSKDVAYPITPLTVPQGIYGVMCGTGLFGTTGRGFIPTNSANIGSPSYFWRDSVPNWRDGGLPPGRLTVYTPEPGCGVLAIGALLALRTRRRWPRVRC